MSIIATPVAFYLGFTKGTGKTIDIALEKVEEKVKKSPTIQKMIKLMAVSDKVFGDDQAVEQVTEFFKEARALVTSPEAKTFFTNASEVLKDFATGKSESDNNNASIKLPPKPTGKKEVQPNNGK
jgi:hypothetical protein